MYYIPLLIVCSLAPGYVGDKDTGATCVRFTDDRLTKYYTLTDCQRRTRELYDAVVADTEKLNGLLPNPWHFKAHCQVPVIDEKVS